MPSLPQDIARKALAVLVSGYDQSDVELQSHELPIDSAAAEVKRLECILEAFNNFAREHISTIHRNHNRLLPVSRLPNELLVNIFLEVSQDLEGLDRYRAHSRLASVSSHWRSTALSSSCLWNFLSTNMNRNALSLQLSRSKQALLDITFTDLPMPVTVMEFLKIIKPQIRRWRTLKCSTAYGEWLGPLCCLDENIPSLEQLVLLQTPSYVPPYEDISLGIVAPSLRVLQTSAASFPLRLEPGLHTRLTHINFIAAIQGRHFHPEDYQTLFSSAPNLKSIDISEAHGRPLEDLPLDATFSAHLPNLEFIRLAGFDHHSIGMILSSITTAPDNYTEVVLATQPFQPTSAIFSRSSSPNSLLSAISRSQWSEWSMYEGNDEKLWKVTTGVELSSGKRVMLMDWLLQGDLPYMVQKLSDTMEAGYLHHLRELKIVGLSYLLDWRLGSSFHRLPNLEVLRIVSREDNEDDEWSQDALGSFLRRLCTSSPTRGRGSVSCPRLRHITIELDFIDWNVLEEIVEARTSIAETNGQCNLVLELANRAKKTGSSYERLIEFAEKRGVVVRDLSRVS